MRFNLRTTRNIYSSSTLVFYTNSSTQGLNETHCEIIFGRRERPSSILRDEMRDRELDCKTRVENQ